MGRDCALASRTFNSKGSEIMGGVASGAGVPHRTCSPANIKQVEEVFARVLDEMRDCATTEAMYEPYANMALYALSNRKIKSELTET